RIGIDEQESYEALKDFVATVAEAGCRSFIVHARKAWLKGLSPKENREIPPLRHAMVHRLKQDFPQLEIIINGGLTSLEAAAVHLEKVDGVMLGRAAYQDPWILAEVDSRLFGQADPVRSREEAVEKLLPWVREAHGQGLPVKVVTRHILGLFNGLPGARSWRRHLSEKAVLPGAGPENLEEALALVQAAEARRAARRRVRWDWRRRQRGAHERGCPLRFGRRRTPRSHLPDGDRHVGGAGDGRLRQSAESRPAGGGGGLVALCVGPLLHSPPRALALWGEDHTLASTAALADPQGCSYRGFLVALLRRHRGSAFG